MAEKKRTRLRICELNPHLLCALCGGYLIDATTIVECLHSFCKTCILRYLETSNYCPICEVLIHKKRPWQNIRLDHTLQNAVYKLVPGLFKREMQRRRDFYEKNPPPGGKDTEQVHVAPERIIFSEDEKFSVSLEFSPNGRAVQVENDKSVTATPHRDKRFLLCPANVCIGHLKKFVRLKYTLPDCYQIDLFYSDEPLEDTYTLMDVAYIYSWRRENVLTLYYSIYQRPRKRRRLTASATATSQDNDTSSAASPIKAKAATTSTSASSTATTPATTTSTVTIVEASDSGSVTEAEGTKTTVSLSIPTTTATLPLPLSLSVSTDSHLNNQSSAEVHFDDDDDDDDDERPLIIVTDAPATSATLMDTDLPESSSGVTIITHPKTHSSAGGGGSGGNTIDGGVAKSSATASGLAKQSLTQPFTGSTNMVNSVFSTVSIPNNVVCSSSGNACADLTGSARVTESTSVAETLLPAKSQDVTDSVSSATQSQQSSQPACCVLSTCPAEPALLSESTYVAGSEQTKKSPPALQSASSAQSARPAESSDCAEKSAVPKAPPRYPKDSGGLPSPNIQLSCPVEQARLSEAPRRSEEPPHHSEQKCVTESSCPTGEGSCPKGSQRQRDPSRPPEQFPCSTEEACVSESSCSAENAHSVEPSAKISCSVEHSCPAGPLHHSEPSRPERSRPAESPRPVKFARPAEPSRPVDPSLPGVSACPAETIRPADLSRPAEPPHPAESTRLIEASRPAEPIRPVEQSNPAEPIRPAESSRKQELFRSSDLQRAGSGKNGSSAHQESNKTEVGPASVAKGTETEASGSGSTRPRSNSSTMGIFERIYSVTSNCTASGIKSIFKTTAIVPAAATHRRYSDVSGTSTSGLIGERRASTGGSTTDELHQRKDKHKSTSDTKQKTSLSQSNRSSFDALTHLTKQSKSSMSQNSKSVSQKVASSAAGPAKNAAGHSGATGMSKFSAKLHSTSSGTQNTNKPISDGGSLAKNQGGDSSASPVGSNKNAASANAQSGGGTKIDNGANRSSGASHGSDVRYLVTTSDSGTKASSSVTPGDLRVRLPKCSIYDDGHGKERHRSASDGNNSCGGAKVTSSKSAVSPSTHVVNDPHNPKPNTVTSGVKSVPVPASGMAGAKVSEQSHRNQTLSGASDRQSGNTNSGAIKKPQATDVCGVKKEQSASRENEKRPMSTSSLTSGVSTLSSSGLNKPTNAKVNSASADAKSKRVTNVNAGPEGRHGPRQEGSAVSGAEIKLESGVSTAEVKRENVSSVGVKREGGVINAGMKCEGISSAGIKRPHNAISQTSSSGGSSAQRPAITTSVSLPCGTTLAAAATISHTTRVAVSASQIRVPSVGGSGGGGGPEAKKARLSNNTIATSSSSSQFSMSSSITPTILSSSCAGTSGKPAYWAGAAGEVTEAVILTQPSAALASNRSTFSSNVGSTGGVAKLRPAGNHAAAGNKLLAPGQRVDSLLFRATNRLAAASAARPALANSLPTTLQGQKKARAESIDSRMSFINKTFGGGKSSKETCVSPTVNRGEISFSARHILSPTFHSHGSRMSSSASKPNSAAASSKDKNSSAACDLSKRSGSSKEGLSNGSSSGGRRESIKLDIPRLSTSSRDSVFASDPESSPTPSPKYSDINRNPIKLEPGSKLCRKETWVSAENGGRRSTGSVGSPNSGPGSPLESERSPARDARRPSDSELLISQRWHGLPHPHLLLPHHRDPATAAAVAAALYNGRFKVPPAAKYLQLAPDHVPRSASPEPMPLDYSTSSSSSTTK